MHRQVTEEDADGPGHDDRTEPERDRPADPTRDLKETEVEGGNRDGMVLGATVGFGFAALESSGYALASLFVVQGGQLYLSLTSVVITELIRGVLSPFGHGMWSAILGAAIFGAAGRRGHLRLSGGVLGTYLAVSVLHGAFDSINGILGYVVVSLIGLVPLIWLWRRADGGGVLPRRQQPSPTAPSFPT